MAAASFRMASAAMSVPPMLYRSNMAVVRIGCVTNDEYPYLNQLSLPDRLRLAAYVASDHGVPAIHLRAILDAAEEIERLIRWGEAAPSP